MRSDSTQTGLESGGREVVDASGGSGAAPGATGGSTQVVVPSNSPAPGNEPPEVVPSLVTFSVVYDENGADAGTVPSDPRKYASRDEVLLAPRPVSLSREGYVFWGWNTQSDGTGSDYPAGAKIIMGTEDLTFYASWIEPVTTGPELSAGTPGISNAYPRVNVLIENINYPGVEGKRVAMAGAWLKEKNGDYHDWNNAGGNGTSLNGVISGGAVSFVTYHNPDDEFLDFKVVETGTWNEVVSDTSRGDRNIVIPMGAYSHGDVIDLHIDASELLMVGGGQLTKTPTLAAGSSDYETPTSGMRWVTFQVSDLPATFNGQSLSLAGYEVYNADGEDRSLWKDAPSLTRTVENGACSFSFYTPAPQAHFKIVSTGSDPFLPRIEDRRMLDPERYIIVDLEEYALASSVLIDWDASAEYSFVQTHSP